MPEQIALRTHDDPRLYALGVFRSQASTTFLGILPVAKQMAMDAAPVGLSAGSAAAKALFRLQLLGLFDTFVTLGWGALGAGRHEAKKKLRRDGIAAGYSIGIAAGLFGKDWSFVRNEFGHRGFADDMRFHYLQAFNDGLSMGYAEATNLSPGERAIVRDHLTAQLDRRTAAGLDRTSWRDFITRYARLFAKEFISHKELSIFVR